MLAFWGNSGIMVCTSSLLHWKLMVMINGKSRGFWVIDCSEDSSSILYHSKGLTHQETVGWHQSSLPMQLICYLSIVLIMFSEFIPCMSCELSYLLKGATVCYSRPTVFYLLGEAPQGVWVCLSMSRAGSCRVCSGRLGCIRLFWPFETLSLDLLGLQRPIGCTLGLRQGYCTLGSVFRLCRWTLLVYPLYFVCSSTSGHCCPSRHFVLGWTKLRDLL